jgi:hypothetical protein
VPSVQGGYPAHAYHSQNHSGGSAGAGVGKAPSTRSSSSQGSNPVAAWVSTQRSQLNQMTLSGAVGAEVDAMLGPPPQRAEDLDLAQKLEKKLQEVQDKLGRQNSERSEGSGVSLGSKSSYSLGEIEREVDAGVGVGSVSIGKQMVDGRSGLGVVGVGGKIFEGERDVEGSSILLEKVMENGGAFVV